MTPIAAQKLLDECEQWIRSGQPSKAMQALNEILPSAIPRDYAWKLANVSRRAGAINLGLKILSAYIEIGPRSVGRGALPRELAEYAVLLQRAGAQREADLILRNVSADEIPEIHLYRAYGLFTEWRYREAVPLLEKYCQSADSSYQRLIGSVNLAAAYIVNGSQEQARGLLMQSVDAATSGGHRRLLGNCFELLAQIELNCRQFLNCREYLNRAEMELKSVQLGDQFFVKKWIGILDATESGSVDPLRGLQKLAHDIRDWESLRDIDRRWLLVRFEEPVFQKLIFGTPYPQFRETLLQETNQKLETQAMILGSGDGPVIDFTTGAGAELLGFESSSKCLSVLEILTRDLYRPKTLVGLFADLYPGEHFDVVNSPTRIHQILRRTRRGLRQLGGAQIVENLGSYRLEISNSVRFRVGLERQNISGYYFDFKRLTSAASGVEDFVAEQGQRWLGKPRSSFHRFCRWALDEGLVEKIGDGTRTRYRIVQRTGKQQIKQEIKQEISVA